MTHDADRLPDALERAARAYNEPPKLAADDREAMWAAIESQAFRPGFASPTADAPRAGRAWLSAPALLPLAAALVLGVAIGRFSAPRAATTPVQMAQRAVADSQALPEPYQSTTTRYLGQTAALLVALPGNGRASGADAEYLGRAHDLLLTTRLLLDSPASADPRTRALFEDLELVLAQIVRLQRDENRAELELIRQALEQRDVLPRLRTAVADFAADD